MNEPSTTVRDLITAVSSDRSASAGIQAALQRQPDFPDALAAQLTGIAVDPTGRALADRYLDRYWADESVQRNALERVSTLGSSREVVIGSGFHAAVYAAVRVLSGHPRPLVLERDIRAGGAFAMTDRPVFYLNSRNRAGTGGLAGDLGASLNYLPGAPIQAANLSMLEYQTNTDMAFVIRLTLAQFADVVTDARVATVSRDVSGATVQMSAGRQILAGRVIDARGLGDPDGSPVANGTTILTFVQFMHRMATAWPLRGIERVAVVGGGDSAKCAVESLLGIAPQPFMAAAALDGVDQIDWYADRLPTTCEGWQQDVRGRYQAIGRYLRPDRLGRRRLQIIARRPRPVALPGTGLIDGRSYDLVVLGTGNRESVIEGLDPDDFDEYAPADPTTSTSTADPVARKHYSMPVFRIGPHARLPFTNREREDGIADIAANAVAMFRTAGLTATLAATLPPLTNQ